MDFLVTLVLPYILLYKYWAIFAITLIAALAFPIPPGTLLMAASAFASQGYLSFFWIVVFGSLGNIVGDNIGYWLARYYGKRVLSRLGFSKVFESSKYKSIEQHLKARPGFIIFITRFEVFANLAVNILSGLTKIPYKKYLFFVVTGEVTQVLVYCSIGYFIGDNWQTISKVINQSLILTIIIVVVLMIVFWRKRGE